MPEIIIRQWVENNNEVGLEECLDFIQQNDLSGPGESDIVTVFDNEGYIWYHNHSGVIQSRQAPNIFPYPEKCVIKVIMGDDRGCDFPAIQKQYQEDMKGE